MEKIANPHQAHDYFVLPDDDRPKRKATIELTTEQIEFFHQNGFLRLEHFVDEDEVKFIRDQYDQWFAAQLGREHGNFFDLLTDDTDVKNPVAPQLLWPSIYGNLMTNFDLYDTQLYANSYAVSKALLGDATTFKGDHAIMKPVTSKSLPTPMHQDEAYWDPTLIYESLGIWVALQPVDVHTGCMQFVPGSHLENDVLPHHTASNNPKIHGLEVNEPSKYMSNVVPCPLPSGGATFHHCRTLHFTNANQGEENRRAYTLQFQCNTRKRDEPRENSWNQTKITEREKRAKESGWTLRAP